MFLLFPGTTRAQGTTSISADSILATARDLSGETGFAPPSRVGRRPSTQVYVAYLLQRLDQVLAPLGGYAELMTFTPDFDYTGAETVRDPYANVVGFVPGELTSLTPGAFLLGAHLDATGINSFPWDPWTDPAPGADDNASGIAVLLEVARVMGQRQLRPQADTYFVFFDGEERQGLGGSEESLLGSRVLAQSGLGRIFGVVNLDMVSYNPRQDSLVVITNITSRWLANNILDAHTGGAAPGLSLARVVKGLGNSDHASFWAEGVDGVMLIEAENIPAFQPNYHRVTDTVNNSYSRGGSQAVKAGELVLGLVESWSQTGVDALTLTDEGVLFQELVNGIRVVDAAVVDPGDSVEVVVTVVNRGGSRLTGWDVTVDLETLDGRPIRSLGSVPGSGLLPAGGAEKVAFPWFPEANEVGAVRARVRLTDPDNPAASQTATRTIAVTGSAPQLVRAYVYPNPTRSPRQATVHYELSKAGAIRASVIDARGRRAASVAFAFDPGLPDPRVDVGASDVSLDDVLQGASLAPGLYFLRLELFSAEGISVDVSLSRFVVLR